MCHFANEGTAWQCGRCGYEFGQSIETLRGMLLDQLRGARITFWILFALDLAVLVGVVVGVMHGMVLLPGLPFIALTWWTVRTGQKISISKHSLALIADKQAELPKATVVSK